MKIRLFKPKTPSNTEISITVEVFNSLAYFCLKGNNLHNRRSPTCGQRRPYHYCLKGRTLAVVQMNIHTGRKEHWSIRWFIDLLMNSGWCRRYNIQLRVFVPSWRINVLPSRQVSDDDSCHRINSAVMKIRNLKFLFLYFPFLYFLLILNCQLSIIHYIITPPRLRRYPSYLKRGVGSHLPLTVPLR